MRAILFTYVMIAAAVIARPADADDATFKTPTGNINCLYLDVKGEEELRCDITQFTPSFKTAPPGTSNEAIVCTPALLRGFIITPSAKRGAAFCPTDSVNEPGSKVLPYGASFSRDGMTCTSETSGMTCKNAAGHGFSLSRAQQKIF
jgi:hypothetical protein